MNPIQFMETVYLGDRAIKGFVVDSWTEVVKFHIDMISRSRSPNEKWGFNNDENVVDGKLVFEGCTYFSITPAGAIPNDFIDLEDIQDNGNEYYTLKFITAGSLKEKNVGIGLEVICKKVYIESADGIQKFYN